MNTCPKCGAEHSYEVHGLAEMYQPTVRGDRFDCGAFAWDNGQFDDGHDCLRRQLAAVTAENERLREATANAAAAYATMLSLDKRKWQAASDAWYVLCNNGHIDVGAPASFIDTLDEYLAPDE